MCKKWYVKEEHEPQDVLTNLPLNPQPVQDVVFYRQTCLHFQQASYSGGKQTHGRDGEFLPLGPVKHNLFQILFFKGYTTSL